MKCLFVLLLTFGSRISVAESNTNDPSYIKPECTDSTQVGFKNRDAFVDFASQLKLAKDADSLLKFIVFPLRVSAKPKPLIVKDVTTFKKHFQEIFTDKVLKVVQTQEQKDIFCNYQGLTIGNGTLWIQEKNGKTGIFSINP